MRTPNLECGLIDRSHIFGVVVWLHNLDLESELSSSSEESRPTPIGARVHKDRALYDIRLELESDCRFLQLLTTTFSRNRFP